LDHRSSLIELLARARRRCFTYLLLDQTALAVTIGMSGAILLLLAGTQILDWYWIVLLAAASLGTGLYRLRKTIPSTYALAQRMDRRLNLADALSTATYFESKDARGDLAVRERQRQEAESVARSVDLRQAVPFKRPRFAYPAMAVAMAAFGLFAVRYAVTGSLSLQPSLVKIAFDTFFPSKQELAKANTKRPNDPKQQQLDPGAPEGPTTDNETAPDSVLDTVDVPDVNNPQAADNSKSAAQEGRQQDPSQDTRGDNSDKGEKSNPGNDANQENGQQGDNSKNGKQQNAKQDSKQGSSNENSSMMDKLRDAMANMLNKMKPQNGQQSQSAQNGQKGGQQDKSSQKGQQSPSKSQSADADAQGDQQQSDGDKKQSAESRGNEKSSDKSANQDSKSGIGSTDGDKAAREAEQLAAMGKISEIIGKRSAQVTGEVMVEVGSSKQQLKTPWAQKQASHVESGSEIHRDEVPLIYQQFVQQYFEEIRKTSPDAGATKPAAGTKAAPKN